MARIILIIVIMILGIGIIGIGVISINLVPLSLDIFNDEPTARDFKVTAVQGKTGKFDFRGNGDINHKDKDHKVEDLTVKIAHYDSSRVDIFNLIDFHAESLQNPDNVGTIDNNEGEYLIMDSGGVSFVVKNDAPIGIYEFKYEVSDSLKASDLLKASVVRTITLEIQNALPTARSFIVSANPGDSLNFDFSSYIDDLTTPDEHLVITLPEYNSYNDLTIKGSKSSSFDPSTQYKGEVLTLINNAIEVSSNASDGPHTFDYRVYDTDGGVVNAKLIVEINNEPPNISDNIELGVTRGKNYSIPFKTIIEDATDHIDDLKVIFSKYSSNEDMTYLLDLISFNVDQSYVYEATTPNNLFNHTDFSDHQTDPDNFIIQANQSMAFTVHADAPIGVYEFAYKVVDTGGSESKNYVKLYIENRKPTASEIIVPSLKRGESGYIDFGNAIADDGSINDLEVILEFTAYDESFITIESTAYDGLIGDSLYDPNLYRKDRAIINITDILTFTDDGLVGTHVNSEHLLMDPGKVNFTVNDHAPPGMFSFNYYVYDPGDRRAEARITLNIENEGPPINPISIVSFPQGATDTIDFDAASHYTIPSKILLELKAESIDGNDIDIRTLLNFASSYTIMPNPEDPEELFFDKRTVDFMVKPNATPGVYELEYTVEYVGLFREYGYAEGYITLAITGASNAPTVDNITVLVKSGDSGTINFDELIHDTVNDFDDLTIFIDARSHNPDNSIVDYTRDNMIHYKLNFKPNLSKYLSHGDYLHIDKTKIVNFTVYDGQAVGVYFYPYYVKDGDHLNDGYIRLVVH